MKIRLNERNLRTVCLEVVLLLASAVVLAFAFPSAISKNGFGFLAVIALIPLFFVVKNTTWKVVWFYGFLYGFVFYWIFNYWLSAFHPLANLLVQVIKGAEMILLFLALKAAVTWFNDRIGFVLQAFVWVAYAYLSQSWFAGYPYGSIAYAFFNYPILIQISSFSGIWLLTFLIVLPQSFAGNWLFKKQKEEISFISWVKDNKIVSCLFAGLFAFQLIFGIVSYVKWEKTEPSESFNVVTIQHNADSWKGGYATYKNNFLNLKRMSLEGAVRNPDLIVWSETAFIPSVKWYTEHPYTGDDEGSTFDYLRATQELVDDFVEFGTSLSIPLLTGNPSSVLAEGETQPYTEEGDWNNKIDYNSVILFDDGEIKESYLKQHLVPFTEHFPYEKQMPWLYNLLKSNGYHWWLPGEESVVFETSNGITFSTPICFEDIFGELCADFVKNGADLLINMTNDSWSGSVAAERQHMAMAVFRAVENRRTMLRSTNSGISCVISPSGKNLGEMEPFKMYWKLWDVPVYQGKDNGTTLYTKIGDSVVRAEVYLTLVVLAAGAVMTCVKRYKKHEN